VTHGTFLKRGEALALGAAIKKSLARNKVKEVTYETETVTEHECNRNTH
jgi:hypothetical protein